MEDRVNLGVIFFTCLVLHVDFVSTSRVLLLPSTPLLSEWMPRLGVELVQKGHDVYTLLKHNTNEDLYKNTGIEVLTFQFNTSRGLTEEDYLFKWNKYTESLVYQAARAPMDAQLFLVKVRQGAQLLALEGESMLQDQELWDILKNLKFKMIFVEGSIWTPFLYIIPYKLGVPFISSTYIWDDYRMRLPSLPSISPASYLPFSDEMSFPQRLKNFIFALLAPQTESVSFRYSDALLKKYCTEKPAMAMRDLQRLSKLWIVDASPPVEYPRLSMPNVIITNGLNIQKPQTLNQNMKTLTDASENGLILVTLQSFPFYVTLLNKTQNILLDVFQAIEQDVIYLHRESLQNTSSNVMIVDDVSQNEILSLKNTKLHISNCDNTGLYPSVYHGVPLICLPFFGQQHYNARKVQEKGYGIVLEIYSLTAKQLLEAINIILDTESYYEKVKKASNIMQSNPQNAIATIAFWVDHVIQHGADHLNSPATDLPWYSLYSVDVILLFSIFVIIAAVVTSITTYRLTCRVYRYFELNKDKSD